MAIFKILFSNYSLLDYVSILNNHFYMLDLEAT